MACFKFKYFYLEFCVRARACLLAYIDARGGQDDFWHNCRALSLFV